MRIAVLAVQGAFAEHIDKLNKLGADSLELRKEADLEQDFDGLILPGGESTVQTKLLRELHMFAPLRSRIRQGLPVLGTCAGLILLAQEISGGHTCFGTLPVRVRRNAYGRQLGSFHTQQEFAGIGRVPMTFIRAPYIETVVEAAPYNRKTGNDDEAGCDIGESNHGRADNVEVLARVEDRIVAARFGKQIGVAFHPELDMDDRIHEMFLHMCERQAVMRMQ
mgnify:CR=1 FL=1